MDVDAIAKDACDYLFRRGEHSAAEVEFHPREYLAERINEAVRAERERCCQIVYGQCGSDNVAERTVRAIRKSA